MRSRSCRCVASVKRDRRTAGCKQGCKREPLLPRRPRTPQRATPHFSWRREGDSSPRKRGPEVADRCDPLAVARNDHARRPSTTFSGPEDPDEALRGAIKAALDVGDLARVRALLDVLDPPKAPALELARHRRGEP